MHSFTVYEEYYDLITLLDEEEQKDFLLELFRYMFEDKKPTLNDKQMKIFKNLKRPLDISKNRGKNGSKNKSNENQNKIKSKSNQNQNEIKQETHQDVNVYVNVNVNVLIEYIESNLGITINGFNYEKIEKLFDDYDLDVLKYAVDITTANNKKTLNYFLAIVRNWKQAGYKTLDEIKLQIKKKPIPEWLNKEITNQELDQADNEMFEEFIEEFRNEKK